MTQLTFAEAEFATKKKKTRREIFLGKMDKLIPWKKLEQQLGKKYHQAKTGRPPYPFVLAGFSNMMMVRKYLVT